MSVLGLALPVTAGSQDAARACPGAAVDGRELLPPEGRRAVRCVLERLRAPHGLKALGDDRRVRRAAQFYAVDMAARGYLGHVSPEGMTLRDRLAAQGLVKGKARTWQIGEAAVAGTEEAATPIELVRILLDSPPHRRLLLSPDFRTAGFGFAANDRGAVVVVDLVRRAR